MIHELRLRRELPVIGDYPVGARRGWVNFCQSDLEEIQ